MSWQVMAAERSTCGTCSPSVEMLGTATRSARPRTSSSWCCWSQFITSRMAIPRRWEEILPGGGGRGKVRGRAALRPPHGGDDHGVVFFEYAVIDREGQDKRDPNSALAGTR